MKLCATIRSKSEDVGIDVVNCNDSNCSDLSSYNSDKGCEIRLQVLNKIDDSEHVNLERYNSIDSQREVQPSIRVASRLS